MYNEKFAKFFRPRIHIDESNVAKLTFFTVFSPIGRNIPRKGDGIVEGDAAGKFNLWVVIASIFRLERQGNPDGHSRGERFLWRLFWYSKHHHPFINALVIIFSVIPIIPLFNILTVSSTGLMNIVRIFTEYGPLLLSNKLYNRAIDPSNSEVRSNALLAGSLFMWGVYLFGRAFTSPIASARAAWYSGMSLKSPLYLRLPAAVLLTLLSVVITTGTYLVTFYLVLPIVVPHLPAMVANGYMAVLNWANEITVFTYIGQNILAPAFGFVQLGIDNAMLNLTALFSAYLVSWGIVKTIYVELTHMENFMEIVHKVDEKVLGSKPSEYEEVNEPVREPDPKLLKVVQQISQGSTQPMLDIATQKLTELEGVPYSGVNTGMVNSNNQSNIPTYSMNSSDT